MSDYSYNDMLRMQSEAKQRVLEMQKRSKSAAESFQLKNRSRNEEDDAELPRIPKAISYPSGIATSASKGNVTQKRNQESHNIQGNLRKMFYDTFGNIDEDEYEKMFIMSLCLLLSKENKDDSLIFALMYLLT